MIRDNPIYNRIGGKYFKPPRQRHLLLRMVTFTIMLLVIQHVVDIPALLLLLFTIIVLYFGLMITLPNYAFNVIYEQRQQPQFDILMITPLSRSHILPGYFAGVIRNFHKISRFPIFEMTGVIAAAVLPVVIVYSQLIPLVLPAAGITGFYLAGVSMGILISFFRYGARIIMGLSSLVFTIAFLVWLVITIVVLLDNQGTITLELILLNIFPFVLAGLFLLPAYHFVRC